MQSSEQPMNALKGKTIYVSDAVSCVSSRTNMNKYQNFVVQHGADLTLTMADADIVLIDTCGFSQTAESDSLNRITSSGTICKEDAKVIVCGCLAGIAPQKIQERFKGEFFSPQNENALASILGLNAEEAPFNYDTESFSRFIGQRPTFNLSDKLVLALHKFNKILPVFDRIPMVSYLLARRQMMNPQAYAISISQGCLGNCSFCVIPFGRGRTRSLAMGIIIEKFRKKVKDGVEHFILNSEDTGAYGADIGCTIVDLLEKIHEIPGKYSIYIHFFDPRWLKKYDQGLRKILAQGKVAHIQLPLQSGSDSVLQRMQRAYQTKHVLPIIREYRKEFPKLLISTQIISGFPGETLEEHLATQAVLAEGLFDYTTVFPFSNRPGAQTEQMSNHLSQELIQERTKQLNQTLNQVRRKPQYIKRALKWSLS